MKAEDPVWAPHGGPASASGTLGYPALQSMGWLKSPCPGRQCQSEEGVKTAVPSSWAELYPDMHHAGGTLAGHGVDVCVITYICPCLHPCHPCWRTIRDLHSTPRSALQCRRLASMLALPEMSCCSRRRTCCVDPRSEAGRAVTLSRLQRGIKDAIRR